MKKSIVIFFSDTLSSYLLYAELIKERPDLIKYLIRLPVIPKGNKKGQSMHVRIAKRSGFAFLWFNFCTIIIYRFVAWMFKKRLQDIAKLHNIAIYNFNTINDNLLSKLGDDKPHWILNNS
ncbi:MAG: hypothetical protein Q7K35_00420, partial [bacterium]|nr:hypothetical protein [bacterium]